MKARNFVFRDNIYPARVTMGALRRFRRETGYDFLQLGGDITAEDLGVLLWCAIASQSKAENIVFDISLDDFFDMVMPDEVAAWYNESALSDLNGEAAPGGESPDTDASKKKNP